MLLHLLQQPSWDVIYCLSLSFEILKRKNERHVVVVQTKCIFLFSVCSEPNPNPDWVKFRPAAVSVWSFYMSLRFPAVLPGCLMSRSSIRLFYLFIKGWAPCRCYRLTGGSWNLFLCSTRTETCFNWDFDPFTEI